MQELLTPAHPFGGNADGDVVGGWVVGVCGEFDDASEPERVGVDADMDVLRGFYEMEGVVAANRFRMLAALHARKTHDGDLDVEWLADTVAADLGSSVGRISNDLTLALQLTGQLPTTLQLLADGRLDLYRVHKIAEAARCLTDDQCGELETRIYPHAEQLNPRQFVRLVNRTVLAIDASATEQRRQQARHDRHVSVEPEPHTGMGWLTAYLPGDDLTAIATRIDTFARCAIGTTDDRSIDQRRADTLRDLLLQQRPVNADARNRCSSDPRNRSADSHGSASLGSNADGNNGDHRYFGRPATDSEVDVGSVTDGHRVGEGHGGNGCGATGASGCRCARRVGEGHGGTAATVYVTVTAETLLGLDERAGELRGYGPITAEHARDLACRIQSEWIGTLLDHNGHAVAMTGTGYRFRGKLAEFIRYRDHTCTHPGCDRPAHRCDIDHLVPWPRGRTTADNASTECRRHHQLKTLTDWSVRRDGDRVIWVTPDGKERSKPAEPIGPAAPGIPTPRTGLPSDDPPPTRRSAAVLTCAPARRRCTRTPARSLRRQPRASPPPQHPP